MKERTEERECIEEIKLKKVISSHMKLILEREGYEPRYIQEKICKNLSAGK